MHTAWFNELIRVTKVGGVILTTSHGEIFKRKLLSLEQVKFDKGEIVVRGNTKEGHRSFAAFHPESYFRKLIGIHEVLEYRPGTAKGEYLEQDLWVIRKVKA